MIQRALTYRQSIHQFVESTRELHPHELHESDWKDLEKICDWLGIFRAATTQMSSTKTPMLSTTHAIFRGLQDKLKEILCRLPDDVNARVKTGILKSHRKLILDPRITYEDLRSDYQDDEDLLNGLERSKADLYRHFDAFYAHVANRAALPTSSGYNQPVSRHSHSQDSPSFDFTARFRQKPQRRTLNELDEYLRLPAQEFYSCDPIQWWYAQRTRFPALSRLAFDILAIPGSAVAVERIFSGGRDTISLRRASLRPDTIRVLMILKQAIRNVNSTRTRPFFRQPEPSRSSEISTTGRLVVPGTRRPTGRRRPCTAPGTSGSPRTFNAALMDIPKCFAMSPYSQPRNINLGCFTLDKQDPLKECYHPVNVAPPPETTVEAITLEGFQKIFSSIELDTSVFTRSTTLKENSITVHKMVNQLDWFNAALRDEGVRSWIEDQLKQKGNIYLVVGYCIIDRTTVLAQEERSTPLASELIEEHPTILERGVADETAGNQLVTLRSQPSKKLLDRKFEGNITYAVQYQKLKFGPYLGVRKATRAQIGIDARWTLMNSIPNDEVGALFQPETPSMASGSKGSSYGIKGRKLLRKLTVAGNKAA
ncbi:hypothetical protein D9613_001146 [Agrocybe pediades]|uniref:HAT C-terminal dimerisation domain-containing protein n=1 Tax=Agrocybe pediades TaxID=84607 RepID=A0A8H4QZG0_9AGAR|nr:hypothetical protein D9613_001146 [Agrocybe pediades]